MPTCFVIQPFDGGRFDKLFDGTYKPAIEEAGLDPYRVDRDPTTSVLIEAIEDGIRNAAVCLADITTNNPNVWYELGFALALGRQVVMVCGPGRADQKFPFDIRHRAVVTYTNDAPQDFDSLKSDLVARLRAATKRADVVEQLSQQDPIAPVAGLVHHETVVLAVLGASQVSPGSGTRLYGLQRDATKAGLTELGCAIAVRKLTAAGLVKIVDEENSDGERVEAAQLTDVGWKWLIANEARLVLTKPHKANNEFSDDIPF